MKRKTENGKVKSEDVEMKSVEGCQSFCEANSANDIFGNRLALTLQWKMWQEPGDNRMAEEHQSGTAQRYVA